jgi:hypothetical protein
MTTVETHFRYAVLPTEAVTFALANIRKVYGIRQLKFNSDARTLCVEYDATRLNAAAVGKLVSLSGLKILPALPPAPTLPSDQPSTQAA